jgi:hypothetical protein
MFKKQDLISLILHVFICLFIIIIIFYKLKFYSSYMRFI